MRLKFVFRLAAPLALLTLLACGGSSGPRTGTLKGTATACYGPGLPPNIKTTTVAVNVLDSRGQRVAQRVAHLSAREAETPVAFSFPLASGRYTATSQGIGTKTVDVKAGQTTRVTLITVC
jgi:hypothetical protein